MNEHADDGVIDLGQVNETANADVVTIDQSAGDDLPKHAVRHQDGSVTLKLKYPVTLKFRNGRGEEVRSESFAELHMHRLTGADMRAIGAASAGSRIVVSIARSARMNEGKMGPLFDRMDAADTNAAAQVVGYFFGSGETTGP